MAGNRNSGRNNPCYGCPDRYPACSDHCRKPDFLAWREEQEKIRANREKYRNLDSYTADEIRKSKGRGR